MSDPTATISLGCQDFRCHGDPWPKLSLGKWIIISRKNIPDEVKKIVLKRANKLIRDAADDILDQSKQLEIEHNRQLQSTNDENDRMIKAWTKQ